MLVNTSPPEGVAPLADAAPSVAPPTERSERLRLHNNAALTMMAATTTTAITRAAKRKRQIFPFLSNVEFGLAFTRTRCRIRALL